MESFLSRYRNLTVLLVVVVAQLLLLGYQVKTNQDVRMIRVWAVSAVTPIAQLLEASRQHTFGVFGNYFVLLGVREENRRLRDEMGDLRMQNQFLRTQLSDADRAKALTVFQAQTQSKTLAARVIANGTGANSATVFVDRGSASGVESGMAVVTPEGIVGKVVAAYPTASLVLLITDPTFAAGVVSQKNRVAGTLKGQGHGVCIVDYIQNEQKVDLGEWFYTSGYDRVFPRGFPVGQVSVVRNGRNGKEVYLNPAGLQGGPEGVLIVLEGVHSQIPENVPAAAGVHLTAAAPESAATEAGATQSGPGTSADRLRETYERIGQIENHQFGEPGPAPNFNVKPAEGKAAGKPPVEASRSAVDAGTRVKPPGAPTTGVPGAGVPEATGATKPGGTVAPGQAPAKAGVPPRKNPPPATTAPKKPSVPLLVTDPTDADPSTPEILKNLGEPKTAKPAEPHGQ